MSKPRSIPAQEVARAAWRRILREVRARTAPRKPRPIKIGSSIQELAAQFPMRQSPRFFALLPEHAALISQFLPDAYWTTLEQAEQIKKHCFDLLGSGLIELGAEINWHRDFKSGHTWPLEHHSRLTLSSSRGGFDVKVPWELSRFHHGVRLGQAYLYTLDESFAQEIVNQIGHWIEANPYEFGVNWAGPMDVAIRVVNWIWSIYCVIESHALTPDFLAKWLVSLQQHGEYLHKHLEDGWPRTNHLIANLTGLAYLGILFPEFPEAAKWKEISLARLWEELERQIYPDGLSYEASTSYHRLVTEMFLSVAALCLVNGMELPEVVRARLGLMLDAIMHYTQPDGLAPQIGDAANDRLHILSVHTDPVRTAQDHRHLLALGSLVLERELDDWAGFVDPTERGWSLAAGPEWQDAFWFFTSDAAARYSDILTRITPRPDVHPDDWVQVTPGMRVRARVLPRHPIPTNSFATSREFEASGLYVLRHGDGFHMTIDAGDVGQQGAGGHAHNDTLSLTLCAYGITFLIDPGSYLYTADPEMRNTFRGTAYHNTLQVGKEEINRLPDREMFRLSDDARVTLHRWVSQDGYDLFDASHDGYARLEVGVTHRRQVWFDKTAGLWILHDQVLPTTKRGGEDGTGTENPEIDLTVSFHFAPFPVRLDRTNNAIQCETGNGNGNLLILPLGDFPLRASLEDAWYSPRYGVRERAPVAKFVGRVKLPADLVLLLYPHHGTPDIQTARGAGRTALLNLRKTLSPLTRPAARAGR